MSRDILLLLCLLVLQSASRPQESFNTTPHPIKSNFTCIGRMTGYYADVPSNCRIYHNCDNQGNKFSYYCPEMTAFRQEALVCDHAYLVDCQKDTRIGRPIHQTQKTSDQSKFSTTQLAGQWTTANPLHNFLERIKNSTMHNVQKSFNFSGTNYFGFNFGNTSETASGIGNNQFPRSKETPRKDDRHSFPVRNETGFFGNTFGIFAKNTEASARSKTNDDQLTVNSRGHPTWYNREVNGGINFRGRPEVSGEAKLPNRHVEQRAESTTTYFNFRHKQTTKSYFNFQNSDYPRSDKADRRSTQIPVSTSATTPATTPSIPVRDFTASLKPLVPNVPEYDPYYPRESWTTTETYYTPRETNKFSQAMKAPNFEPSLVGIYFKIPDVWPDLNTLDDIVDRRKLFYIPKTRKL